MYTPFEQGPDVRYSGVAVCTYETIKRFNAASKRATDADGLGCSICQDTMGLPEGKSSANLSIVVLEKCKHQFHEICLMEWLSPVVLSRSAEDLDPVLSILKNKERYEYIRAFGRRPFLSIRLGVGVSPINEATADNEVIVAAGRLLQAAREADDEFEVPSDYYDLDADFETVAAHYERRAAIGATKWTPINSIARHPVPQALPAFNLEKDHQLSHRVALTEIRGAATTPTCPHCRQRAHINNTSCHADSLVLIRARLRLTNLAYQCFGFTEHPQETLHRQELQHFLHRRFLDTIFLAPEPLPSPQNCQSIFTQARLLLRDDALRYLKTHPALPAHESIRALQLAMFYENFPQRDEHVTWFFNPDARLDSRWRFRGCDADVRLLNEEPWVYCRRVMIFASGGVFDPPVVRVAKGDGGVAGEKDFAGEGDRGGDEEVEGGL
ncbi:MAG: hypothetical protein Q9182_004616 [Xanthomendoza sp. 2 TL-2023]